MYAVKITEQQKRTGDFTIKAQKREVNFLMDVSKGKREILMCFMREGILLPIAINTITEHLKYTKNLLSDLTKDGYISNRKINIRAYNRTVAVTYKSIRPKGVQWLKDNCCREYPWLRYLPNPVPKFSTRQISNTAVLYKFLQSVTASIIFSNFGINTVETYQETKNSKRTVYFKEMVMKARADYAREQSNNGKIIEQNLNKSNIYYHSRDISSCFSLTPEEVHQQAFSTHNGLLVIRSKSYFVYTGSANGVTLYKGSVNRARVSAGKLLFQNSITDELYNACQDGIIFCKNAKEWENTFRQLVIPRKSGKEQNMNELFGHLHLLPIRRESMYELDMILYHGIELTGYMRKKLMGYDGAFVETDDFLYKGNRTVIGFDMDIVKLQRLYRESMSDMNRNNMFVIVCRKWQVEFYKRVMPNNVIYYIEENIN